MNIFEKMEKEILNAPSKTKKIETINIGHMATLLLEVAWRNEEDRAEAEKVASKYRHGIAKGGMISGLPITQGASLRTSWSTPDAFYGKHPEEYRINSGPGEILKMDTTDKIACRLKVTKNDGFYFNEFPQQFQLWKMDEVLEDVLGEGYDVGRWSNKKLSDILDVEKRGLSDFLQLKQEIILLMNDFLNKTITLDKFDKENTYPDIVFDIVEIEPIKIILFKNIKIFQHLEFEKTGKVQEFLKPQSENSK